VRDAWNHAEAAGDASLALERQAIVLTVPASFDEEARELTVDAARDVGLEQLTLLEEPLAALYAWMATHPGELAERLVPGALLLVCDVGGGTTDFTLVRAASAPGGLRFERTAVGDHLLLGGDNVDLALAALVERKLPDTARLSISQRQALRRQCSAAKERLLSNDGPDRLSVTVLGTGRKVIGGALVTQLSRDEVLGVLNEFLPVTAAAARPQRQVRGALRELGLPYESDPAVTRHLAAFLERAARMAGVQRDAPAAMQRPDAVLFNGGFFIPAVARERILDTLASWFGERPIVLTNDAPEAAVALGAAYSAALRYEAEHAAEARGPALPLIRAGSARSYYVGVQSAADGRAPTAVCVLPRGTQEGTQLTLDRQFTVVTNQPAAFTLFSSAERSDALDAVVTFLDGEVHRHASLVTAFRYGQRSRQVPLGVRLSAVFTEVGTLELWCESRMTEHRWRLQFNLRATEQEAHEAAGAATTGVAPEVIVPEEAVVLGEQLIRNVFSSFAAAPETIAGELENVFGHGRQAWPLPIIRRLVDVLLEVSEGRRQSARHEARWLNLTGFCLRPGFGTATDPWRVGEVRRKYVSGVAFPKDTQCQVEWLILLQRVSAGFSASQQQELANRILGLLGLGTRTAPRPNPQIVREAWRLLAGLERLDGSQRARLGDTLIPRVRREAQNTALLWAIGRFGTRVPLYGPLNAVVAPAAAERWLEMLLALRLFGADTASAVAQVAARTDDPARDISDAARSAALARLIEAGAPDDLLRTIREHVPIDRLTGGRIFGEALPEGLRLEA
jgi:hypothetical protein